MKLNLHRSGVFLIVRMIVTMIAIMTIMTQMSMMVMYVGGGQHV